MTTFNLPWLRQTIANQFTLDQFKNLCQDLAVKYDNLPGESSIESKARELLEHLDNRGRLDELVRMLNKSRPSVDWVGRHSTPAPGTLHFPIHELPLPRNPNLTGRENLLAHLHTNLTNQQKRRVPQALVGMGGVGKTQTALEYAYRYAEEYDLTWWIRAETSEALTADYMTLTNRLELAVKTGAEQSVFVNIVHYWLKQTSQRWLLIFDNADEPQNLRDFLPYGVNGHVIITSQNPNWGSVATVLQVGLFTIEEATRFMQERTGQEDTEAAKELAEAMGRLPLALEQAGAFIEERKTSLSTYLNLFKEQRAELWQREHHPSNYNETVTTTWELAFQQVRTMSEAAIELLNICTFLSPEEIPISLFINGAKHLPSALAEALHNPLEREDTIAALYRYSLIQRSGESLSIHRLIQAVGRDRLGPERIANWVEITVHLLSGAFSFDEYDLTTWPRCAQLLAHVLAISEQARKYQVGLEDVGTLCYSAAQYLRVQGEYPKAQIIIEQGLVIQQGVSGEHHPDTVRSHDFLGELLQEQGQYKQARLNHERALAIREQEFGLEHPDTATSLHNLGSLLASIGDYAGARIYSERALAIREQILGSEHPETARSLHQLGSLLASMGNYSGARPYFERALAIRVRVLSPKHPDTAISLNDLGYLLYNMGDHAGAKPYFERALVIREQVLGSEHPKTALSLTNLGTLLTQTGDYGEARTYYERALAVHEQVLGAEHPNTALCLHGLGTNLSQEGKFVAARSYLERALKITERLENPKHPSLVPTLFNLGGIMFNLGQFVLARRYLQRARDICKSPDVQYAECQQIEQLWKNLPGKIGKPKRNKKKR